MLCAYRVEYLTRCTILSRTFVPRCYLRTYWFLPDASLGLDYNFYECWMTIGVSVMFVVI
eukprot:6200996-Pleurochrysis_carterae.AAC.2